MGSERHGDHALEAGGDQRAAGRERVGRRAGGRGDDEAVAAHAGHVHPRDVQGQLDDASHGTAGDGRLVQGEELPCAGEPPAVDAEATRDGRPGGAFGLPGPANRRRGGGAQLRVHVGPVPDGAFSGPVRLPVRIVLAFANHLDGENAAALGAQVAGQGLGHQRHHAIGIGVGEKPQPSEVDGQDGNLAVMEQVHGMQHGAVAAEHDDQRQLPGQLRAHFAASRIGAQR